MAEPIRAVFHRVPRGGPDLGVAVAGHEAAVHLAAAGQEVPRAARLLRRAVLLGRGAGAPRSRPPRRRAERAHAVGAGPRAAVRAVPRLASEPLVPGTAPAATGAPVPGAGPG